MMNFALFDISCQIGLKWQRLSERLDRAQYDGLKHRKDQARLHAVMKSSPRCVRLNSIPREYLACVSTHSPESNWATARTCVRRFKHEKESALQR